MPVENWRPSMSFHPIRPRAFHRGILVACLIGASAAPLAALAARKSTTPVASSLKKLKVSPQELRIRVRALIRPTLGIVEEAADQTLETTADPLVRRGILRWKIEMTTTLLSAMLRRDPVLAIADSWAYAVQVRAFLASPPAAARFGESAPEIIRALTTIESELRDFCVEVQPGPGPSGLEQRIYEWAERNPIEGSIYRRPPIDASVATALATSFSGGAFAALGNLDETTADILMRMDLYTMYLPRLGRWETELVVDDLLGDSNGNALVSEFGRVGGSLGRISAAADRVAGVADDLPRLAEAERTAILDTVRAERLEVTRDIGKERTIILDALHQERLETLEEVEAMAQRLMDRAGEEVHEATRRDVAELTDRAENLRLRMTDDIGRSLDRAVDRAFLRGIELLAIGAGLAALGVLLYARFLRR
jgi:hypothetical protein